MKKLLLEFRLWVATHLLSLAFDALPDGKFKVAYSEFLIENLEEL